MSVKKKTCRICAKEDLHANFVNIFELTVNNVNADAADEKISLFETMRQLTGIKVKKKCFVLNANLSKESRSEKTKNK